MVTCNSKLVLVGFFALIGLTAAEKICPVRYEGGNPQMRKAFLDVDIGSDFFTNGWKLQITLSRKVREVEAPGTSRELTTEITEYTYQFMNRGYNALLKGPKNLLFQITELAEGQGFAEVTNAKIAEVDTENEVWYELCQDEIIKPPPPPNKPCSDFYTMNMNDAGHGQTNEYEGDLTIIFSRPVVGFSFDITYSRSASVRAVFIDNVKNTNTKGSVFSFKPYQENAQIKVHKGENIPKWELGHFKVTLKKSLARNKNKMPVPVKIVSKFHGNNGVEEYVMCEG